MMESYEGKNTVYSQGTWPIPCQSIRYTGTWVATANDTTWAYKILSEAVIYHCKLESNLPVTQAKGTLSTNQISWDETHISTLGLSDRKMVEDYNQITTVYSIAEDWPSACETNIFTILGVRPLQKITPHGIMISVQTTQLFSAPLIQEFVPVRMLLEPTVISLSTGPIQQPPVSLSKTMS
ncbi:hypothetical protein WDW89_05285 [Deltaproteobacteria bacterium TL4]